MASRIAAEFARDDAVLFLALFWAGGRPCSLAEVLWLFDWMDRSAPTAAELSASLSGLLAAGVVSQSPHGFRVPPKVLRAFGAFKRSRRRRRLVMGTDCLRRAGLPRVVPRKVRISEAARTAAYGEYQRLFDQACKLKV